MKIGFNKIKSLLLLLPLILSFNVFAQTPTYTLTFINDVQTANNVLEFDIYLLRTGATPFELASIQFGILYNNAMKGAGTMTAAWVPGSVDPLIVASGQQNTAFGTATAGCIKIAAKLAAGGAGTGAIISNVAPGSRVGRLRLTNSEGFANVAPNISLNYTSNPYNTAVFAYVGGLNTPITNQANHFISLSNAPLPVELGTFTVNANNRNVTLNWQTKTEINTASFLIERKESKSSAWTSIGNVAAAGNSNSVKVYSYTDQKLNTGKYSYRLKMVDLNGSSKYSDVVEAEVAVPTTFDLSQNYPNPFNPSTRVDYQLPSDAHVVIDLYSLSGERIAELVNREESAGYYSIDISSNLVNKNLSSGIYLYRMSASDKVNNTNFSSVKKMVMLK